MCVLCIHNMMFHKCYFLRNCKNGKNYILFNIGLKTYFQLTTCKNLFSIFTNSLSNIFSNQTKQLLSLKRCHPDTHLFGILNSKLSAFLLNLKGQAYKGQGLTGTPDYDQRQFIYMLSSRKQTKVNILPNSHA